MYKAADQYEAYLEGVSWPATDYTYVSWWFRYDTDVSGTDHSSKWIRVHNTSDGIRHTFSWTQMHNVLYGTPEENQISCSTEWHGSGGDTNQWHFYEAWFDTSAGRYTLRIDGAPLAHDVSWSSSCASYQFNELWKLGFDGGGDSPPRMSWWMDDIYVDSSFARVMLGNAPTYSGSSQFEMQPTSSWSAESIEAEVNQGAFTPGSTAYLYVVDSGGTPNESGFPVTFPVAP